jgi:hypothetical protein
MSRTVANNSEGDTGKLPDIPCGPARLRLPLRKERVGKAVPHVGFRRGASSYPDGAGQPSGPADEVNSELRHERSGITSNSPASITN